MKDGKIVKEKNGQLCIFTSGKTWDIHHFKFEQNKEVFLNECGWEIHHPTAHRYNKECSYYIFHYVVKGKGYYKIKDKTYQINAFTGFILPPSINFSYWADSDDPWQYYWVGISGPLVSEVVQKMGITKEDNYIFVTPYKDELMKTMEELCESVYRFGSIDLCYMLALGKTYEMLAYLVEDSFSVSNSGEDLGEKILKYVNKNYRTTTVKELSDVFYFNRSYLYKVFMKKAGVSLNRYIIDLKLREAIALLRETGLSIDEISERVGFNSSVNFCIAFKKAYEKTPTKWREETKNKSRLIESNN